MAHTIEIRSVSSGGPQTLEKILLSILLKQVTRSNYPSFIYNPVTSSLMTKPEVIEVYFKMCITTQTLVTVSYRV